jgi:hypothetical protein
VKANQPTLQKSVFATCLPLLATTPEHFVEERAHGRINRWSTWTTDATGIEFPHAAQLGCVRRDVLVVDGIAVSKEFLLIIINSSPAEHTSPPTYTPTYPNTGPLKTKTTTSATQPGTKTTTKPGSKTDHKP